MAGSDIPVIDLSSFREGEGASQRAVAAQVARACETLGFLVVAGHGVGESVSTALYEASKQFFELPLEEKLRVRRPRNDQNRGYILGCRNIRF